VQSTEAKIILQVLGDQSKLSLFLQKWDSSKLGQIFVNSLLADLIKEAESKNDNRAIEKILNHLKSHLSKILYKEAEGDEESMKRLIRGSGLTWEKKLAEALAAGKDKSLKGLAKEDLKSLLLSLKNALSAHRANGQESENISQKVERTLQFIEQNQLLNLIALKAGMGPLFFIPGFTEEGLIRAEVFLKEKRKKEGGEFHLILFMQFTQLGPMEAHITFKDDKIHLQMFLADQDKADFLKSNQAALEAGFKKIGITLSAFNCSVKNTEELGISEFLEKEKIAPSFHLVI
jgi:hypothetical protein